MAPRKTVFTDPGDAGAERAPTDTEMKFFKAMMENMNTKPDVNWENVAGAMGLKDAKCARERYRQMCVKLGWNKTAAAGPASGRKSNTATADLTTPTKTTRVTKRTGKVGSKKIPIRESHDEEDGDETLGDLEDSPVKCDDGSFENAV